MNNTQKPGSEPLERYEVFTSPKDNMPFWSALEEVGRTPKGKRVRFKALHTLNKNIVTYDIDDLPASTIIEALEDYQRNRVQLGMMWRDKDPTGDIRIQQILRAEELKECPKLLNKIFKKDIDEYEKSEEERLRTTG